MDCLSAGIYRSSPDGNRSSALAAVLGRRKLCMAFGDFDCDTGYGIRRRAGGTHHADLFLFQPASLGLCAFSPMLTGLLTIAALLLGIFSFIRFSGAHKCRKAAFLCSSLALVLSLAPLLLFGSTGMTAASYCVTVAIAASCCLLAVANRNSCPSQNNI